jgi:tetratricopeptide (TPR) repeat protein
MKQKSPLSISPHIWLVTIIFAVACAVNFNSIFNGFVYDDISQILGNRWITDIKYLPDVFSKNVAGFDPRYATSYYRPMMYVIYMCNYFLFGLHPWGYHLTNILLHSSVSVLVYLIVLKIVNSAGTVNSSNPSKPAFLAALIFATHTVHSEPVAWVAALPELSFTLFYLLSFYSYIKATEQAPSLKATFYTVAVLAFFVSTLSKETALTLPVMLLVYDYYFRKDKVSSPVSNLKRHLPFWGVVALYFVLRIHALGGFAPSVKHKGLSAWEYFINGFPLFSGYLGKLFLPVNLSAFHGFHPISSLAEPRGIYAFAVTALFLTIATIAFRRSRESFFGLVLLLVSLLPALYIPGLGENAFAERQVYLPSVGFVVVLAWFFSRMVNVPRIGKIALLLPWLMIVAYSAGTVSRNGVWKDEYSLWADVVEKHPDSATAHAYLGYALYQKGMVDEAIDHYQKSLMINPDLIDSHINLGVAYSARKLTDRAIDEYQKALALCPSAVEAHTYLGEACIEKGWTRQAIEQLQTALSNDPDSSRVHHDLGIAYGNAGLLDRAVEHFEAAVRLEPSNPVYRENLAKAQGMKYSGGKES